MDVFVDCCETSWGWLGTAASLTGLLRVTLPLASEESARAPLLLWWPRAVQRGNAALEVLHEKLRLYFLGRDVDLSEEVLDLRGASAFQARVWQVVRVIPRGQVRSYGWVASQVGSPGAARAVGQSMANNPFPIVVPCHRVVGSRGQLTGFGGAESRHPFGGGLEMKRRLLDLEGALDADGAVLTMRR